MLEILALPGWNVPRTTLENWTDQLAGQGLGVVVSRESTGVAWIKVEALRLLGYAVMEGLHVEAINFELNADDPGRARDALVRAAEALGWELDEENDDEDDVEAD